MGDRTWIYHETEEPKIIDSDDIASFEEEGWRDSPAPFVKIADFNVDTDDSAGIQQLGDSVQGVADALNGALNLEKMTKDELEDYAKDNFGIDIDRRKSKSNLIDEIQALIDGNG